MSCTHATSGCNYPHGDCTGACMTEQGRESQRLIRVTMAAAPKRHLTLVYQIHSESQYKALLSAAEWVDASDSHAIAERYDLQKENADLSDQCLQSLLVISTLNDELGQISEERDALKQALQYAVNQVPELITVPGIRAAIKEAGGQA